MLANIQDYRNNLFNLKVLCKKNSIKLEIEDINNKDFNIKKIKVKNKEIFYIEKIEYSESNSFFSDSLESLNNQYKNFLENQRSILLDEYELLDVIFS